MRNLLWFVFLLNFIIFAESCKQSTSQEVDNASDTIAYRQFIKNFDSISIPFALPKEISTNKNELADAYIEAYFAERELLPVFDEVRDVPGILENLDAATYFASGIYKANRTDVLIIEKRESNSSYFYLFTFTPEGSYINGICLAFSEGDDRDKTERQADVKEDYSIQVRQSDFVEGEIIPGGTTEFFEINADGELIKLDKSEKNI